MAKKATKIRATYSVSVEVLTELDEYCEKHGLVKSQFVERAIAEKVKRAKNRQL